MSDDQIPERLYFTVPKAEYEKVQGEDDFKYIFFIHDGKRYLWVHGMSSGLWPYESKKAIDRFKPDVIFCCHPRIMFNHQHDERIYGWWDEETVSTIALLDGAMFISVYRKNP